MFAAVDGLGRALDFHRSRHSVLASNLANVDTPNYRSIDIQRAESLPGGSLARTDDSHLTGVEQVQTTVASFDSSSESTSANGNTVSLERELAKLDANRVRYQASSELVTRRLALLRYAATDGNG